MVVGLTSGSRRNVMAVTELLAESKKTPPAPLISDFPQADDCDTIRVMETIDEVVQKILEHPKGNLLTIIRSAYLQETGWLEFKAAIRPGGARPLERGEIEGDFLWNVAEAAIAMRNSIGGLIILGMNDEGKVIGLGASCADGCFPFESNKREEFIRTEIADRTLNPKSGWSTGRKGNWKIPEGKKALWNDAFVIHAPIKIGDEWVLPIIVNPLPAGQVLYVENLKNNVTRQVLLKRDAGAQGRVREVTDPDGIAEYKQKRNPAQKDLCELVWTQFQASLPSRVRLPPRNPKFSGRVEELENIKLALESNNLTAITALHGIAGIGKSALALEYAYKHADLYPGGRLFLSVEGQKDMRRPIADLAPDLGVNLDEDDRKDLARGYARVLHALQSEGKTLLILDNVDDIEPIRPANQHKWRPPGDRVHVLVTTRIDYRDVPGIDVMSLDTLNDQGGLELLCRHTVKDPKELDAGEKQAALDIVRHLGGHALSLEISAVYLSRNRCVSFKSYLDGLNKRGIHMVDDAGKTIKTLSFYESTLVKPILDQLLDTLTPLHLHAMECASFLPPDFVSELWLIKMLLSFHTEILKPPVAGQPRPIDGLFLNLDDLQLLKVSRDSKHRKIHRVVQLCIQARLDSDIDRRTQLWESAIKAGMDILDRAQDGLTSPDYEHGFMPPHFVLNSDDLTPFAYFAITLCREKLPRAAEFSLATGRLLIAAGAYDEAERILIAAGELCNKSFGSGHPLSLSFSSELVEVYYHLGDHLLEAYVMMSELSAHLDQLNGKSDPQSIDALIKMIKINIKLEHCAEADAMISEAVSRISDCSHAPYDNMEFHVRKMLNICSNPKLRPGALGERLRPLLDLYGAARKVNCQWENELVNLGHLFISREKASEAVELYRYCLENGIWDRKHLLSCLASALCRLDRQGDAENIYLQLLEESKGDADKYDYYADYADFLEKANRLSDAEQKRREVLELCEKRYGANSNDLARPLTDLARVLLKMGKHEESATLLLKAAAMKRTSDNEEFVSHKPTQLSELLDQQQREMADDKLLYTERHFKGGDFKSLSWRDVTPFNIALLLRLAKRTKEAEELFNEEIARLEKKLGVENESLVRAKNLWNRDNIGPDTIIPDPLGVIFDLFDEEMDLYL